MSSLANAGRQHLERYTGEPDAKVYFSKAQLEVLEKMFPEVVLNPGDSEATLRHYHGMRKVVHWVRSRTK